jgi:hypothetical protein
MSRAQNLFQCILGALFDGEGRTFSFEASFRNWFEDSLCSAIGDSMDTRRGEALIT